MKQIVIVADERPGLTAEVTRALARDGINIETIDAEAARGRAVIVMTVDCYDAALGALRNVPDIQAISEDALVVRIVDRPGAVARIASRLADAGIGMRSLRIVHRGKRESLVAISTPCRDEAAALLADSVVGNTDQCSAK